MNFVDSNFLQEILLTMNKAKNVNVLSKLLSMMGNHVSLAFYLNIGHIKSKSAYLAQQINIITLIPLNANTALDKHPFYQVMVLSAWHVRRIPFSKLKKMLVSVSMLCANKVMFIINKKMFVNALKILLSIMDRNVLLVTSLIIGAFKKVLVYLVLRITFMIRLLESA